MTRGQKHVLPRRLASASTAVYDRLELLPGPWLEDVWVLRPHAGDHRRTALQTCLVDGCEGELHEVQAGLCHAHSWQWIRAGRPTPVEQWLPSARPPQKRVTARSSIDFRPVPALVAHEVRYVVGTKITSGDWTPNKALRATVAGLLDAVERAGAESLLDHSPAYWEQMTSGRPNDRTIAPYLKTFFATLHRAAVADPWAEDSWLWRGGFELVLGNPDDAYKAHIHWGRVAQPWLREGVKVLAKRHLVTRTRAWDTILTWSVALSHLSAYLTDEGISEPAQLDRELFLDYLADTREGGASKNVLMGVNTAASILADLRQDGVVTGLGSEVYLRRGENSVKKAADPRPFPADVVERIDHMIEHDTELDEVVRVMLRLNRWGGLRISELVRLPLDCLRVTPAGRLWLEYFMTKTQSWRRFPIPDDLGAELRAHQDRMRELFGPDAALMFPSLMRSSRVAEVMRPWSCAGLRTHTAKAFVRNGITHSSLTGEPISGAAIHRFRHTIGTTLLNSDWSQRDVQEFLGHQSATMTGHYARITDETLTRKTDEFHAKQQLDRIADREVREHAGVERLRAKFTAVLADGYCQLPLGQRCDFQQNPCKSCAFYDDGGEDFRSVHDNHRRLLKLFVVEHQDDPARVAVNQANLDALNDRVPEVS